MRSKALSSGDRALLDAVKTRGCAASPTQIERWRYWRKSGFVERPLKHGKGRGSYSEYPDLATAADRVCEAEPLVRRYDDLDFVALILCARGRPVDPSAVKDAFLAVVARLEHDFRSRAKTQSGEDAVEAAYDAARALVRMLTRGKRARERRQAGHRPPDNLLDVGAIAACLLLGDTNLSDRQLEFLIESTGLAGLLPLAGLSTEGAVAGLRAILGYLNFCSALRALGNATGGDIVEALRATHSAIVGLIPARFAARWSADLDSLAVFAALGYLMRTEAMPNR